jgi:Amt family ammonium transporter
MPFATAGVFLLWLGWFGFNGGSVLSADPGKTSIVLVTTCLAASAGGLSAFMVSLFKYKQFDLSMFLNGVLGGLVGITAGADIMSVSDAIVIGFIAGALIVLGVALLDKLKLDDPVGAIAVHLICGVWGTLAVGIFGELAGWKQFGYQLIGVVAVGSFCLIMSYAIIKTLKSTIGIRVSSEEEQEGLDIHEHGMDAYPDFRLNQH